MARKWPSILVAILLSAIAVARIVSTYPVFSPTFDEPAHLAAGIELLAHDQIYHGLRATPV
jgi:hypothetical protein